MSVMRKIKTMPRPVIWGIAALCRALGATMRLDVQDRNGIMKGELPGPFVFAFWHNRLLLLPAVAPEAWRTRIAMLISQSRDGGYVAAFAKEFGLHPVRGSSSRGGAGATLRLRRHIAAGGSIAMTPDGPRGPRYHVHDGLIRIAAATGAAIVPVSLNTRGHWSLHGWDRTQIPRPFTEAELIIDNPISIPQKVPRSDLDHWRQTISDRMSAITRWDNRE